MKKYDVHYVRIEHQLYLIEVEADSKDEAEEKAEKLFCDDGLEDYDNYKVVHAEEFVNQIDEVEE
jgi:hypothetical protein